MTDPYSEQRLRTFEESSPHLTHGLILTGWEPTLSGRRMLEIPRHRIQLNHQLPLI